MKKWSKKILKKEKGFTLIELIIVIAIIAILAAVLIPRFANFTDDARRAAVEQEAQSLVQMVNLHYADNGSYPNLTLDEHDNTLTYSGSVGSCVVSNVTTDESTGVDIDSDGAFSYKVQEEDSTIVYTVSVSENGEIDIKP